MVFCPAAVLCELSVSFQIAVLTAELTDTNCTGHRSREEGLRPQRATDARLMTGNPVLRWFTEFHNGHDSL